MSTNKSLNAIYCPDVKPGAQASGSIRTGLRRFRCAECGKTYTEPHKRALEGSYIPRETVVLVLRLMVEGNSLRSTQRITGLDINTLMKILVKAGEKCEQLMGRLIVNVPVKDVECDKKFEAYVQKKEGHENYPEKRRTTASVTPTASSQSSATRNWS